jgi:radical SAM protein with 4Fe4S-binding SPASM domain
MIDFKTNRESIGMKSHDWEVTEGIDDFRKKMFISWDGEASDVNELIDQDTQKEIDEFVANGGECYEPFKRVSILYDGRVVPCCFDYVGKYILGDINKKKLVDIWNDEPMLDLRKEFKSRQIKNKLCNNCKQKPGMIPVTTTL